jgi:hypothetical protein
VIQWCYSGVAVVLHQTVDSRQQTADSRQQTADRVAAAPSGASDSWGGESLTGEVFGGEVFGVGSLVKFKKIKHF